MIMCRVQFIDQVSIDKGQVPRRHVRAVIHRRGRARGVHEQSRNLAFHVFTVAMDQSSTLLVVLFVFAVIGFSMCCELFI